MKLKAFYCTILGLSFLLMVVTAACHKEEVGKIESWESFDGYYWCEGEKVPLTRTVGQNYVIFYSANEDEFRNELTEIGYELSHISSERKEFYSISCDMTGSGVKKFTNYKTATITGVEPNSIYSIYPLLSRSTAYLYAAPFYLSGNGNLLMITEQFSVKLKSKTKLTQLEHLAKDYSVEIMGADKYSKGWYILACTKYSSYHALIMANRFYQSGLFEEVRLDL